VTVDRDKSIFFLRSIGHDLNLNVSSYRTSSLISKENFRLDNV
jgi:hypothetical protein